MSNCSLGNISAWGSSWLPEIVTSNAHPKHAVENRDIILISCHSIWPPVKHIYITQTCLNFSTWENSYHQQKVRSWGDSSAYLKRRSLSLKSTTSTSQVAFLLCLQVWIPVRAIRRGKNKYVRIYKGNGSFIIFCLQDIKCGSLIKYNFTQKYQVTKMQRKIIKILKYWHRAGPQE